jgi:hypothetical protein
VHERDDGVSYRAPREHWTSWRYVDGSCRVLRVGRGPSHCGTPCGRAVGQAHGPAPSGDYSLLNGGLSHEHNARSPTRPRRAG